MEGDEGVEVHCYRISPQIVRYFCQWFFNFKKSKKLYFTERAPVLHQYIYAQVFRARQCTFLSIIFYFATERYGTVC